MMIYQLVPANFVKNTYFVTRYVIDEHYIEVKGVKSFCSCGLFVKSVTKDTVMPISNLCDKLETQLRASETLGIIKQKYAVTLFSLIESAFLEE